MSYRRIEYEADAGEYIEDYAKKACAKIREYSMSADTEVYLVGNFNDFQIITTRYSTPEAIVHDYRARVDNHMRNKKKEADCHKEIESLDNDTARIKAQVDEMMEEFKLLDKTNDLELVKWLGKFAEINDNIRVSFDRSCIVEELKKLGYYAGMYCVQKGEALPYEKYAGWFVGQCIDQLERVGRIHPMMERFAKEYEEKLGNNAEIERG